MKKLITIGIGLLLSAQVLFGQMTKQDYSFRKYLQTTPVETTIPDYGVRYKHERGNTVAWQILGVAAFANITEAIGDALYDIGKENSNRDKMMLGKGLQAVALGSRIFYIPIMRNTDTHWGWLAVSDVGIRLLTFDAAYNITRELPVSYIGSSTYYDKILKWTKQPAWILTGGKMVVATFTISLTFEKF